MSRMHGCLHSSPLLACDSPICRPGDHQEPDPDGNLMQNPAVAFCCWWCVGRSWETQPTPWLSTAAMSKYSVIQLHGGFATRCVALQPHPAFEHPKRCCMQDRSTLPPPPRHPPPGWCSITTSVPVVTTTGACCCNLHITLDKGRLRVHGGDWSTGVAGDINWCWPHMLGDVNIINPHSNSSPNVIYPSSAPAHFRPPSARTSSKGSGHAMRPGP